MPHDSPYRQALVQNIEDAFDTRNFKCVNFTRALYNVLKLLGVERRLESSMRALFYINAKVVEEKLMVKYKEWVISQVMTAGVGRGVIGQYFSLVGTHEVGHRPVWYCINVPHKVAVRFLRFRIGCHHLRVNAGRWQLPVLPRRQRKCIRCADVFDRAIDIPVDDEDHCLIHCQEPVLTQHRVYLEYQIRRWLPHAATNSMKQLFSAAVETGNKGVLRQLMGYVACCYRVAQCCHEDMEAWQNGSEVQQVLAVNGLAAWVAHQEVLYARGMVPGLPSDSSIDDSSELSEVSMHEPGVLEYLGGTALTDDSEE
jgi:hypothetical protein